MTQTDAESKNMTLLSHNDLVRAFNEAKAQLQPLLRHGSI